MLVQEMAARWGGWGPQMKLGSKETFVGSTERRNSNGGTGFSGRPYSYPGVFRAAPSPAEAGAAGAAGGEDGAAAGAAGAPGEAEAAAAAGAG